MDALTITPYGTENEVAAVDSSTCDVSEMSASIDHMKALLQAEESGYSRCEDYLSNIHASDTDPADRVSEAWRRKLCEWCYEVVDHFNFDREVVSIALSFLDRVVGIKSRSASEPIPKREFQLLAVTSLYLAIKLHGECEDLNAPRRKLRIEAFVELSRGFFSVEVIEETERNILEALKWRVNPPTLLRYISTMVRLLPEWGMYQHPSSYTHVAGGIYDVARYLSELSVCISNFVFTCNTSVTAYASILCAMEALQGRLPVPHQSQVLFLRNIEQATGLTPDMPSVVRTRKMVRDLCPGMFTDEQIPEEFLVNRTSAFVPPDEIPQDSRENSPVCVVTQANQDSPRTRRKRSRSAGDESRTYKSNP